MPATFAPEFISGGFGLLPPGQTSDWSDPKKFVVAPKGSGSQVAVSNLSAELLGGNIYLVRGEAEPGTTIRAVGRETLVSTGKSFQVQITAPAGDQQITVEALDLTGTAAAKLALSNSGRGRD